MYKHSLAASADSTGTTAPADGTIQGSLMTPIGKLIKDELKAQERSVSWFARKLHLDRSNVYRLFQKNSIDTDLLSRISIILGRNFFEPLSDNIKERNRTPGQ